MIARNQVKTYFKLKYLCFYFFLYKCTFCNTIELSKQDDFKMLLLC